MGKRVFSSLIAVNGMLTSHWVTICQHLIIILHTILVSTRNYVTAKPRNNIFAQLPCLQGKAKAIELPFCAKESSKKKNWKLF